MSLVSDRITFLDKLLRQPFVRFLLAFWAATGAWDLVLSEWVPEEYAKRLPRVYQVIAVTTGLFSWQIWIVVGALIFAFAGVEYGFRRTRGPVQPLPQSPSQKISQPVPLQHPPEKQLV